MMNRRLPLLVSFLLLPCLLPAQQDTVLMFVSHEQTYYSEYIVMYRALQAAGYTVDVRSASTDSAGVYMVPSSTDIEETANTLSGSSYSQFTAQFNGLFGSAWNASWNSMPQRIPVSGRIQDISSISRYAGFVIAGGTGAIDYRVDGSYAAQGSGDRAISAVTVQAAAESLNALALAFLRAGKPVMAQCHAASLPVFWRIPGTSGSGDEALGYSLLKSQRAAGFPEAATATTLAAMDVTYRPDDRVTVASPHSAFDDNGNGDARIVTTRDWYPQTVAHAARTFLNILTSYPAAAELQQNVSVLLLHGGAVNTSNCSYLNRANDVPCNYGGGSNIPADYTDLAALFAADSPNDAFSFTVTDLNMTGGSLPYTASDQSSVLTYLSQFDVVLFFKHWSTGLTPQIEQALVQYADNGGGVLGLHHALYNDVDGSITKDILTDQLFGANSAMNTWSGNLTTYNVYNTDLGNFITTYGVTFTDPSDAPAPWSSNALPFAANSAYSTYQRFSVYDEIYGNLSFVAGQTFGRGVGQITPLFSNDQSPSSQSHTTGFVKQFDPSANGSVGKVAYFEIGERKENLSVAHAYGQVLRNAAVWLASASTALPVELVAFTAVRTNRGVELHWNTATEVNNRGFEIQRKLKVKSEKEKGVEWETIGFVAGNGTSPSAHRYSFTDASASENSLYRLKQIDHDGGFTYSPETEAAGSIPAQFTLEQNFPNPFNPSTTLRYTLAASGPAVVTVHDLLGREVRRLAEGPHDAGLRYERTFDASGLSSGVYIARLLSGGRTAVQRMLLLR